MPFTDPMADGPIVQAAGKRGLQAGVKVRHVLAMVREFRLSDSAPPVILMGYLNPILSYGPEKFCLDAAAAGVDGLIVVDLPPEESDMLLPFARANGLDFIRLVAPTTDDARLPLVMAGSSGFVYYRCHYLGITGTRSATNPKAFGAGDPSRLALLRFAELRSGSGVMRTPTQAAESVEGLQMPRWWRWALIDTLCASFGRGRTREAGCRRQRGAESGARTRGGRASDASLTYKP